MALTRTFGFSLDNAAIRQAVAGAVALGPYLDAYKAQYGTPQGTAVVLGDGTRGHFDEAGLFVIDQPGGAIPPAAPTATSSGSGLVFPTSAFNPSGAPPSRAPAVVPGPAASGLLSRIPPLVWVGAGGLVLFLIARRL